MLKELSKLWQGLLLMQGHAAVVRPIQSAACGGAAPMAAPPHRHRRRSLLGASEWLTLAPIWIVTPVIVLLALADLVHPA
jgi:hypothetical protein